MIESEYIKIPALKKSLLMLSADVEGPLTSSPANEPSSERRSRHFRPCEWRRVWLATHPYR